MMESAEPFGPPIGSITPFKAAPGSLVGLPSASSAQSGGICSPRRYALYIFPRAAIDGAISKMKGFVFPPGAPQASGDTPINLSLPPQTGNAGEELVKTRLIMPASTAC